MTIYAAAAPPPAQYGGGGGGMLSGLGGMVAQGMAFGGGSAMAHRAIDSLLSSSNPPPQEAHQVRVDLDGMNRSNVAFQRVEYGSDGPFSVHVSRLSVFSAERSLWKEQGGSARFSISTASLGPVLLFSSSM